MAAIVATDFTYDGRKLSDIGFMICDFNGTGMNTTTAGSRLDLATVSQYGGRRHALVNVMYSERFEATFDICKDECNNDSMEISVAEYRYIMHWLNKKQFADFTLDADEWTGIHFRGTFPYIEKYESDGVLVGFSLTFSSNAPFGYGDQMQDYFSLTANSSHTIDDNSDEFGDIPFDSFVITCGDSGDLELTNAFDNRTTVIKNCTVGEVITINGKTMTVTSSLNRNVYDDFNFVYPMLSTTAYWYIDQITPPNRTNYTTITETLDSHGGTIVEITTGNGDDDTPSTGAAVGTAKVGSSQVGDDVERKYNTFSSTLPCSIMALYTPIRKVVF